MSNLMRLPIPERTIAQVLASGTENGVTFFSVVYPTREGKCMAWFTVPARSIRRVGCWLPNTLWFVPAWNGHALYFHPEEKQKMVVHRKRWWLGTALSTVLAIMLTALAYAFRSTNAAGMRTINPFFFAAAATCFISALSCLLVSIGQLGDEGDGKDEDEALPDA